MIRKMESGTVPIIFLVGPTAVGKSEVAVTLAKKINAEIISCDSMQVYKGMEIITSAPALGLRRQVKHHLIGAVPALKEYDAARYRQDALKKIAVILRRGKVPLFTGGTGLYVSVLVNGIFNIDCRNDKERRRLYKLAETKGSVYLHQKLKKVDPSAALKIHPNDTRRMVRALEVFNACGRPISQLQKQRKGLADEYGVRMFCLNMERDSLYQRIDQRVDQMFESGLLREVRRLLKLRLSRTARLAIGIRELEGYLQGEYGLEQAKDLIRQNTRQYAKRQLTWFRKDKRIKWIEVRQRNTADCIARKICKELN